MDNNIEKIKILITRVKKGTKSGIALVNEVKEIGLEIEMIDGKKYGLIIYPLNKKENVIE